MKKEQIVQGQKILNEIIVLDEDTRAIKNLIGLKDNPNPYKLGHLMGVENISVSYDDIKHLLNNALKKKEDELNDLETELEKL